MLTYADVCCRWVHAGVVDEEAGWRRLLACVRFSLISSEFLETHALDMERSLGGTTYADVC